MLDRSIVGKSLRVSDDTVIKKGDPALMRVEVEKMTRAYQVGKDCGLFDVPRILDYNDVEGRLVMERIPNIRGIRWSRLTGSGRKNLFDRVGRALSAIHQSLKLPDAMIIPLCADLEHKGSEVFLHGDFSGENVCVTEGQFPNIVLLDWQMTEIHGGKCTFGTRYFDVAWFINNLFTRPIYRHLRRPGAGLSAQMFFARVFQEKQQQL